MKLKGGFKALASIFSALCLLPAACSTAFAAESWQEAYLDKADEFPSAMFMLYDIDGDEIPEMIINTNEYSADCWQLYTYYSGESQKFFEESIRAGMHFYSVKTGVFCVTGSTAAGRVINMTYYKLENGASSEICSFTHDQMEMADSVNDDHYINGEVVDAETYDEKLSEIESEYSASEKFEVTPTVFTYDGLKQHLAAPAENAAEAESTAETNAEQPTDTTEVAAKQPKNMTEDVKSENSVKKTSSPKTEDPGIAALIFDAAVFGTLAFTARKRK